MREPMGMQEVGACAAAVRGPAINERRRIRERVEFGSER